MDLMNGSPVIMICVLMGIGKVILPNFLRHVASLPNNFLNRDLYRWNNMGLKNLVAHDIQVEPLREVSKRGA